MQRRQWLSALVLPLATTGAKAAAAPALPQRPLQFPRDFGSHPDLRTEWWYLTGRLQSDMSPSSEYGFQITFFRTRMAATQGMTSRFAAKQLLFAHAAITDVQDKKLWHDQRIAREGFEVAQAAQTDTRLRLQDWSLVRDAAGYTTTVSAQNFRFSLTMRETQPRLLQGSQGLSRKGPLASQASYYYSLPQLAVKGTLAVNGLPQTVQGKAWLDHEWSNEILHAEAVGWDWIGMNLLDGSALTAFRLRDKAGHALWDGGSFRAPNADVVSFSRGEVIFQPTHFWKSPLSNASYPVAWIVHTPAGDYTVRALVDNQELDSRASTGAIYWEGLSELIDSNGQRVGHGYLEMTGYAGALRL